ncbi:hypothetical protein FBU59_003520 [Linderina macrospora]|uniref:Uncharacterized protein n=1 Tax=Linderina macrospora TaxID=4868 RepID=A0ACC1J892_9FUNG|nr:hypothetical protein FBU59_003520 [Linderina macrospora]
MVEVANSPVVSVYALIAQQIDMRRYYLELPMVERAPLAEPADGHQNAHKPPATQTNATQIQFAGDSADGSIADGGDEVDEEHKARQRQDALARLLRARPHNIFHRLSSQITSTLGGHSHSPEPGKKRISLPAKLPNNTPAVTQPLKIRSIGVMEEMSTRITLPTDLTGIPAETVLGLVSRLLNLHMIAHTFVETRKMPVHKALDMSMFSLKTIAAMMSSVKTTNPGLRPTDAFHPPPTTVHDADNDTQDSDSIYVDASSIGAFTDPIVAATAEFPLPPQAPMPPPPSSADRNLSVLDIETGELHGNHRRTHHNLKALLSYMVPKGLRAATADTPSDDQAATANITDGGNKPSYFTKLTADPGSSPGGGGGPGKTGLSKLLLLGTHKRMSPPYQHRRRNSISDTTPSTRLTHNPAVDSCTTSGGQQGCSGDEPADSGVVGMPEIITTVPVQYATPVVFAQYSPSLNRWRETEVVEYYSCSVRIELVRIGGSESRHRYALLVDRMTGHKGKFALFRMFLRRMITALPMLEPEKFSPHMPLDPLITVM